MPDQQPLEWPTPATAKSEHAITVTEAGLTVAREECLTRKGLAISTPRPPSASFAAGVVYQALANKQASQANSNDEAGGDNAVRLYPFDKRIMAMLIVPEISPTNAAHDRSFVRSLIG